MQKYKIIASKSQKKYTIIVSADSESEAKEQLHKENYSILSISKLTNKDIQGQKFIFQVEHSGNIKNGVIVGKDIFKVYIKLKDDLWYNVIFLYPEGDEAHANAEKKQKIIRELERWYEIQKKQGKIKEEKKNKEQSFYLKKQLDETYILIEKVLKKFDLFFNERTRYKIDDETFRKMEQIYERLLHIKGSTNLSQLKKIGELALIKIAQIELDSVEKEKDEESRKLLKNTNNLLKEIWSNKQFIESNKDFKKIFQWFISQIQGIFSFKEIKKTYFSQKKHKNVIDSQSYAFLKTILLLEKYKEKLHYNTQEIKKNIFLFINPFNHSDLKEKISLKRKVIKQNISILRAKKTWSIGSYTGIKKWYHKTIDSVFWFLNFLKKIVFMSICFYMLLFLISLVDQAFIWNYISINPQALNRFLLFFLLFFTLSFSKNIFLLSINIVFFMFISIFSIVNF